MKILVIGGGGREHALAWKLSQEAEVICAPGNAGIAQDVECVPIQPNQEAELVSLCQTQGIDLVVVGPEDPLINGIADKLRDAGLLVFGPDQAPAQLEGSKAYSKEMMARAGVPTAEHQSFQDPGLAKDYCRQMFDQGKQVAVKASGNALGKGVIVCDTVEDAISAVDELTSLGEAGKTLVVEERMSGREFSLLTLVSDGNILSLPLSQDYKRIGDGDFGPNTGGMGTYSPLPWIDPAYVVQVENEIVIPMIRTLADMGISYRGVLFSGIMVTPTGPKCIEYNVRFGDPETQTVMMRLGSGLANALLACAKGEPIPTIEVKAECVTTVVASSEGYPGNYEKGRTISFGKQLENTKVFHAGTKLIDGDLVTNGGRVLAVTAIGLTIHDARSSAYRAMNEVCFEGMHFRKDIGA